MVMPHTFITPAKSLRTDVTIPGTPLYRDFNRYYDTMPGTKVTGKQNIEFVKFSSQAQKAASQRLETILKLLPQDAVQQAVEASKMY